MFKDIILAVVQGITEFIPVSSSGHLVLFNEFLEGGRDVFFYVSLHLGTTLSLILFFFKDILAYFSSITCLKKIMVVTGITGLVGFIGKEFFENLFDSMFMVSFFLALNGLILIFANLKVSRVKKREVSYVDAFVLGLAQSFAIIPGISRSGVTISTLLMRNIEREEAFRFSFVSSVLIVIASFLFKVYDNDVSFSFLTQARYLYSIGVSFLVGYISLFALSFVVKKAKLNIFGYYCLLLSLYIIWLS